MLLKVLRSVQDRPVFDREWKVLEQLQRSEAPGAAYFTTLVPQPVKRGPFGDGPFKGRHALALRWVHGFDHTLERVRQVYPQGIDPPVSIWIWRRTLEVLTFLHRSGIVHGSVVPPHILIENGEHGARLVGYGASGEPGSPLEAICNRFFEMYPEKRLSPAGDVTMSARSIAYVLGSSESGEDVPSSVPEPLARLIREAASGGVENAWDLRERVGQVARDLFGPPSFRPLFLPV